MTSAQITPGRSEVSALIGTFQFEDRRFDDSGSFGAVYRYYVTRRYSFEAGFALSRPSFTGTVINETTNTAVSKLNADATVFLYHVNAIYNFILSSRVVTFTTGGIGRATTDIEDLDATSELSFNFGGGINVLISRHFGIRAEVRDFVSSIEIGGFLPSRGRIFVRPDGDKNTLVISFGLIFPL